MNSNPVPKILIIAGSDPSGGAGIQADIKTATAHEVYAAAAITCLTAQNTEKVFAVYDSPIDFLRRQIEAVFDDMSFDAIKIGMLGSVEIIDCVADVLSRQAKEIPLVLDTVMVATSGDMLLKTGAVTALKEKLINVATVVTPNIHEAEVLAEMKIESLWDMQIAALKIKALGTKNVLLKGGHLDFSDGKIHSILIDEEDQIHQISNKRIGSESFHGTGCTLASALACNLAKKQDLVQAARNANQYVYRSLVKSLNVGKGSRVLQHF